MRIIRKYFSRALYEGLTPEQATQLMEKRRAKAKSLINEGRRLESVYQDRVTNLPLAAREEIGKRSSSILGKLVESDPAYKKGMPWEERWQLLRKYGDQANEMAREEVVKEIHLENALDRKDKIKQGLEHIKEVNKSSEELADSMRKLNKAEGIKKALTEDIPVETTPPKNPVTTSSETNPKPERGGNNTKPSSNNSRGGGQNSGSSGKTQSGNSGSRGGGGGSSSGGSNRGGSGGHGSNVTTSRSTTRIPVKPTTVVKEEVSHSPLLKKGGAIGLGLAAAGGLGLYAYKKHKDKRRR